MTDIELIQSARERIVAAKCDGKTWVEIMSMVPGLTKPAGKAILTGHFNDFQSVDRIAARLRTGKVIDTPFSGRNRRNAKISGLMIPRNEYAGVGTRRVKLRLNKLVKTSVLAKALRIALETEDKNLTAKKYHGGDIAGYTFDQINYFAKHDGIAELIEICKVEGWRFGVERSDVRGATHVIYFHLPGVEQISWHFTPKEEALPTYDGVWDQQKNSTLKKLEPAIERLLRTESLQEKGDQCS
jgi:hypothetical protein